MAFVQQWEISNGAQSDPVTYYGRTENFNYFVKTPVEDEVGCAPGVTKQSGAVKDYKRRRYPGDTSPVNIPAIPEGRQYLYKANKRSGNALPGRTITFATNPETWDGGDEKRSFQYVGDWKEIIKYLESDASKDIIVTNHTGARVLVCAADAGGGGE